MGISGIDYVEYSWGPWMGCPGVKDDPSCANCYAHRGMKRYGHNPYKVVRTSKATWHQPLTQTRDRRNWKWEPGSYVFVCPWSDFFLPQADEWRSEAWDVMRQRPDLVWVLTTKQVERVAANLSIIWPSDNRIIMATTPNQELADKRTPHLLELKSRFANIKLGLSIEPLLGEIDFRWTPYHYQATGETYRQYLDRVGVINEYESLRLLDWLVLGCQSLGRRAGKFQDGFIDAALKIVRQGKEASVPTYMKQACINGMVSKDPSEWLEELQKREKPI